MRKRLGELLEERGQLSRDKLDRALRYQTQSTERIGTILIQLGFVAEKEVAQALADQLGLEVAKREAYTGIPIFSDQVSPDFLRNTKVVPLLQSGNRLVVSMADPLDDYAVDALGLATGLEIDRRVGVVSDIESALQRHYAKRNEGAGDDSGGALGVVAQSESEDIQHLKDLASEAPTIRLVNTMISRALSVRASDIHVEPFESSLKVRYRVDGVLQEAEAPPQRSSAAVISRIKVMANLNIAERWRPQDGRIKLPIEGREIDMRVSTVPTLYGESVVLRILDRDSLTLDFSALGFTSWTLPAFEAVLRRPHGIVLVTGPTGSGKTTTLYAALQRLNTSEKKILTVEDPVEYQLEGVNQIQVKTKVDLTFANALRSILRQDPDVIMVGEMRDQETARIAVQAALTGHKVFSTLHTNDAASSVTRLLDMKIEDYLVTSTVDGILGQRLVRTLCGECREAYEPLPAVVEELGLGRFTNSPVKLYRARGCQACDGAGYRGRTSILEFLTMTEGVRQAVLDRADAGGIQRAAMANGMTTMYEDGLRKAVEGVTTVEEVARVVHEGQGG